MYTKQKQSVHTLIRKFILKVKAGVIVIIRRVVARCFDFVGFGKVKVQVKDFRVIDVFGGFFGDGNHDSKQAADLCVRVNKKHEKKRKKKEQGCTYTYSIDRMNKN